MKKIKILMLEDVVTDAKLNAIQLSKDGFNFTYKLVSSEDSYIKAIKEDPPDLILSDYSLPQFNGLEALEILQNISPEIPFIMVTGSLDDETAAQCIKQGAWDYVIKERIVRLGPAVKNALQIRDETLKKKAVEMALKQNERKFQNFTELLPEVVCETDLEGNLTFVNKKAFEVFGYTSMDLKKKLNILNMLAPFEKERVMNNLHSLFKGKKSDSYEYVARRKDGTTFPVMIHANVVLEGDLPIGMRAVVVDITAQKNHEEIIRQNAEKMSLIIDNSPIGVCTTDLVGNFQTVNPAYCNILGYSSEELIGKHFNDFTHSDDISKNKELFNKLVKSEIQYFDLEKRYVRKDKEIIICRIRAQIVHNAKGKPFFEIAVAEDITAQKKALEELKYREEFNFALFHHNPIETMVVDKDGRIMQTNQAIINNRTRPPEIGAVMYKDYAADHEIDMFDVLMKCIKTGKTMNISNSSYKDKVWMIQIAPFREGAIITSMDITARKHAEQKLVKSLQEKDVLLKEVHHRVKNNMQIISSMLKLQARHITNEEALQHINDSQNRVRSMALIHEKLYQTDDFEEIEFYGYVRSLINYLILSYRELMARISIQIEIKDIWLDINTSIPCGLIINELITNSLKYAFPDDRKGIISISLTKADSDKLKLEIKDNGIGFPKGFTIETNDSLGLQLVTALSKQLHATLEVKRDEGVCFTFEFKLKK
jgi:PAS domain S-box-containing protein